MLDCIRYVHKNCTKAFDTDEVVTLIGIKMPLSSFVRLFVLMPQVAALHDIDGDS